MLTSSEYLALINSALKSLPLPASPERLYAPVRYSLEQGGKRIRPVLVLAVADALGVGADDALAAALVLEIFHNFTLLHDDIMDRSDLRRGRLTVWKKWDESCAILSGDAMLTFASQILMKSPSARIRDLMNVFNSAAMAVYEGQQLDLDFENRAAVTEDEYFEMIDKKTSALLVCACRMGAICADAPDRTCNAFSVYGDLLGKAFQLRDDYLDTFGDSLTFGKPIGGDILNEKKTWMWIMARGLDPAGLDAACCESSSAADKIERVRNVYVRNGIDKKITELIGELTEKALYALSPLGLDASASEFFSDFAHSLTGRSK